MNGTQISSGWKIFMVGGCAVLALCGATMLAFVLISTWTTQAAQQPVYSAPQQSYESVPEEDPGLAPQQSFESIPQEEPVVATQQSFESVPQEAPASVPQASIDPDLVGHWRYTSIFGSGDLTIVTDYHMEFGSDGRFVSYNRGEDGQTEDYVEGNWSATDTEIIFTSADGTIESYGYQIFEATLIFDGTSNQFWEKISS